MKKKLMFVICTIVVLCVGSLVSAATTLKDIKNTKYEDSVNTLITLGLVNGYPEDDTYRPNNTVTRAEMAKLMVVALGEEGKVANANKATSKFKDMKNHWAYGYVNVAAEIGIINGYPDGTFGPNNTVSYAEATAMVLRALEYEDEVNKSKEVWPTNYINQAQKLSLYKNAGTLNANDGAKRGNVAIILWNMLRTGVCTPVGQNSTGVVYGEGEKMINKKMTKFTYLDNVLINDVEFDDDFDKAEITIKSPKKITITMDALEAAEMYGQRFNILYNVSSKKVEQIEDVSTSSTKEGEIEKITKSKIYIDSGSSKGYELPDDDNILLYGIEDLEDATSAILVFDGSKLEYIIAFPPEHVYIALVTDTDITVSKKDGIKVVNYKTSSSKSYALADEDDMPDEDDIILYYLNSDNEIVIIDKTNLSDSEIIESASKTKITLEEKGKITLGDTDTYEIMKVNKSSLKSMSVSDIEPDDDSASVIEFGGIRYIIVYVDGAEESEKENATELKNYQTSLTSYITKAKGKSEKSYTQASFAALIKALDAAEAVKASTTNYKNLSKVKTAYTNLKSAYDSLKTATTSTEKDTVAAKYALRELVNSTQVTTAVKNKAQYTTETYATFEKALKTANEQLAKTNATKANLESAKTKLQEGVDGLVRGVDDEVRKEATTKLNVALESAKKIGSASEYTKDSYDNFEVYYNQAKAIKTNTDSTEEIKKAAENLERAIRMLEKGTSQAINTLNSLLLDGQAYMEDEEEYMPLTFSALKTAIQAAEKVKGNTSATATQIEKAADDLKSAIKGLRKINDVLKDTLARAKKYKIDTVTDLISMPEATSDEKLDKISALEVAMEREDLDVKYAKIDLETEITKAKNFPTLKEWEESGRDASTFDGMKKTLENAESILKKEMVTSRELKTACKELTIVLEK